MRSTTTASWLAFLHDEAHATNGVNEPYVSFRIDLLAQACHLDIDDVVEWRCPARLFPDVAREHLPRHEVAVMAQQILEELELPHGQVEQVLASGRAACHQ